MKPIKQLALYKSAKTSKQLLQGFLRLTNNEKRHIRGPMYSNAPGTGKGFQMEAYGNEDDAVSACALGILRLLTARDRHTMRSDTQLMLDASARRLYPYQYGFIDVSDHLGLKAIRRVVKDVLSEL